MFSLKGYAFCARPILAPFGYQKLTFALHFRTLGDHFGISGLLWRTMEEAGRARVGPEPDLHRLWVNFGTLF